MAQQTIGIGSSANDGTGDPLRTAWTKANANFTDLYTNYATLANPTFTGTVSGVTKAMVGLGNVDNTSDSAKPISTATQTALDGKVATTQTVNGVALSGNITAPTVSTDNIIVETTDARTLSLTDLDKFIICTNASGCEITIPTNAAVAIGNGKETIIARAIGAGELGLITTGITLIGSTVPAAVPEGGAMGLKKQATDTWWAL